MVRTKLTARRWPRTSRILPWLMNRRQQRKVKGPFKIKLTLPEQKTVDIKKNGNVIKTIRVRRKSKFFNDKHARTFNLYFCIKYSSLM